MFISKTSILNQSEFSRGSRCRAMVDPADKPSAVLRFVGVPSAESHIGGEDAVGERTADGMQVWSGIAAGTEGIGLFEALSSFLFVTGRRVLDG
jgi:hypothetical protein